MRRLVLIGAGMGTPELLTGQARQAIARADHVLASSRLADGLRAVRADIETVPFFELAARAEQTDGVTAILLSGDTGFFSAAKRLRERLCAVGTVEILPGIGSIQLFCAKFHTSYDDAALFSLHGRAGALLGPASYCRKAIFLTGGENRAQVLCRRLADAGLTALMVYIGENLGMENERLVSGPPEALAKQTFGDLCVMMTVNDRPADAYRALRDSELIRGDVPMTKQEIRWLAAELLSVRPEDTVYDIGAGTGSVTMELARRASRGMVYAVECRDEALALLEQNRVHTGCYNTERIAAAAPDGLEALPVPDCAFIGGSRGRLPEIIAALLKKNPSVRLVISAISLETLHEAVQTLESHGIAAEVSCIGISRARKTARYHMMTAQNPVYLIGGNL